METLTLGDIPIQLERKRIKHLYLRVKPPDGRVVVTAPMHTPAAEIQRFVDARLGWIAKNRARYAPTPATACLSGETHRLWGVPYRLQVAEADKRAGAFADGDRIVLRVPLGSDEAARKRALDNWYKKQLLLAVERETEGCETIVGARASGWRVRDMTSRWGTCNTQTAMITLNLQLAKRDPAFLRYVMLHELTHLLEPSHNQRFYRLMDGFCPAWRQIRKALKQKGEDCTWNQAFQPRSRPSGS